MHSRTTLQLLRAGASLYLTLGLLLNFTSTTQAADVATNDAPKSIRDAYQWVDGPNTAAIKSTAEIKVPAGFMFTGSKGAQELLEMMGNPTSGNEVGFLAPTNLTWFVVFEFDEVGYVKDDDKDKLDADKMLDSIKEGTEEGNKLRKEMGVAPMKIVGWEQKPKYDELSNNLEWAIRGESEGEAVLNYNTRLLGRKGVMQVSLVVEPDQLAETLPVFKEMLTGYSFKVGERYAEYKDGDKLAQFGLAALITGGAAAVAVKTGLLGTLALFFKKAWKLIIIVVVAIGGFIGKFFGKKKDTTQDY